MTFYSYDHLITCLHDLESWFSKFGRHENAYLQNLKNGVTRARFLATFLKDPQFESEPDRHGLLWSVMEAADFAELSPFLDKWHAKQPKILKRKLRIVMGATLRPEEEGNEKSQPRDALFELILASQLESNGGGVTLDAPADLTLATSLGPLLIECKRPSHVGSLDRNLGEAREQLIDRTKEGHSNYGIIAIDATRVVNPQWMMLTSNHDSEAESALQSDLKELAERHRDALVNVVCHPVLAVLFKMSAPFESVGGIGRHQSEALFTYHSRNPGGREYVKSFLRTLSRSPVQMQSLDT